MIFLTEDKNDKTKDTQRIEAESWGIVKFIAIQLGLIVIGEFICEIELNVN